MNCVTSHASYCFARGFLASPKRFNVAISRAKALLVVVGNPEVLAHDVHWCALLRLVLQNRVLGRRRGAGGR